MINVQFFSLSGKFTTVKTAVFDTDAEVLSAVKAHAESGGFRNVKQVDDDFETSIRFTATTPGGRAGRNIASADYDRSPEDY